MFVYTPIDVTSGASQRPVLTAAGSANLRTNLEVLGHRARAEVRLLLSRENVRVSCRAILSVEPYFPKKTGDVSGCCSPFPIPEPPAGRRVRQREYAVAHG